jgi:hypothetical protein
MSLRDTLRELREQQQREARGGMDRPAQIAEWKETVDQLMTEIRGYLSEYEQDGSLSINLHRIRLNEEDLGSYEIAAMDIKAGPILILVRPIARFVSGAEGRVDMHRQGRPGEEHRVMFFHMRLSGPAYPPIWCIQFPAEIARRLDPVRPEITGTRRVAPLDKVGLELAIEFLLK